MFKKILIANRGEIALRIYRACREMNIRTVAIHSTADEDAMHARLADECICIGPAASKDSYLNKAALLAAVEISGAEAVHPGVGFLSENADFAEMVEEHGQVFIGPKPEHIRLMGDKVTAKEAMIKLGIPVVPGSDGVVNSLSEAREIASNMGYPVLVKAAAGGGGRGMKVAHSESELEEAFNFARSEALAGFGDDSVFIEKYLEKPRHIEFQILADKHGNAVHLGERDCSVQRRHQKVWEEAPSPVVTPEMRAEMGDKVVQAVKNMGYVGAGTFEFLFENGQFYFIEMNTRIQVEHPISEMITGIDLVQEQIKVAYGEKLSFTQDDIKFSGHAIECRVNAEHPETFMPSPGLVTDYHPPGGLHVRVDSPIYTGYKIPPHYDSLVAKLIVYGKDRPECIRRLHRAIEEFVIGGIETLLPLHKKLSEDEDMQAGDYDIHWLEREFLKK
ncbi:MAG: acetyl-CoA carboxylase biotin carboxylase subunit [Rickettsiales bacterium]|nr:acetyl-CoA carboxylase biotin carboxylase subunit [Rickettsiales bacterium]|tara:strand:- start:28014 stop:29354 length:1341 start_codon:yes stop_codon:yes gene_type:complete